MATYSIAIIKTVMKRVAISLRIKTGSVESGKIFRKSLSQATTVKNGKIEVPSKTDFLLVKLGIKNIIAAAKRNIGMKTDENP